MIFDTHAHYDDKAFDADRTQMLASLAEAGIGRVVDVGSTIESNAQVLASQNGWEINPVTAREFGNDPLPAFEPVRFESAEALLDDGSAESLTKNVVNDFVDRCLDRNPAVLCPLEEGHRSTTFAHLANIAWTLGRRLEWDGDAERFVGCDEANAMLHYEYRKGYSL